MKWQIQNLSFSYKNGRRVLENISFSVASPQVTCLLGPNGVGKSTLLRCLLGLQTPQSGQVLADEKPMSREVLKKVGYVPQQKSAALNLTVLEMVMLGRSAHLGLFASPGAAEQKLARECLAKVGLSHLENRLCGSLSGGEYQLALFARALAVQPEFLVLDEPESNLDLKNKAVVISVIQKLCRSEGLGVLWVTHSPADALQLADRVLLLKKEGEPLFGIPEKILTSQNLSEAYGLPLVLRSTEVNGSLRYYVLPENLI